MKNIIFILTFLLLVKVGVMQVGYTQVINWHQMPDSSRHVVSLYAGYDFSFGYGLSYGQRLRCKVPVLLSAEGWLPSGKTSFDDVKGRIGGQAILLKRGNFRAGLSAGMVYRRYQSALVAMNSIGGALGGVAGYYRPRWHIAGEAAVDQVVATHFRQQALLLDTYPDAQSGWYRGGGTLVSAGMQTGVAFRKADITLRLGYVFTPLGYVSVVIPYSFQVGINKWI